MQSSALRSRPVWKSTRPDDPPGIQSPPKASGSPSKHGRLRMDVQMAGKTMLVDALTLCDEDFSKGQIKQKLEAYVAGPRTNDVVELVIVIMAKTAASGRVDQLHRLSQVQLLLLDIQPAPVLLAESPADAESVLRKHLKPPTSMLPPQRSAAALQSHATAAAPRRPLSQQDAATLHSIFPSIKELEAGTKSPEGQALVSDFLDPASARDVIDFWEDEYLAT